MHTLFVHAVSHTYPIYIGSGILQQFELLQPHIGKKVVIISNTTVATLYLDELENLLKNNKVDYFSVILPDGEQYKNHKSLNQDRQLIRLFQIATNYQAPKEHEDLDGWPREPHPL